MLQSDWSIVIWLISLMANLVSTIMYIKEEQGTVTFLLHFDTNEDGAYVKEKEEEDQVHLSTMWQSIR